MPRESRSCVRKHTVQTKSSDSFKVTQVAGDQLEVVVEGGSGNLKISVIETPAGLFEFRSKSSEHLGYGSVIRKNRCGRENALFDTGQVTFTGRGTVGPVVKLTDRHDADELILARDHLQPAYV
jgi:hypothetical protein